MGLSRAQESTLQDMLNAPEYCMGEHQWCDTHIIREDGETYINGNWNSNTLRALERKGYIRIVKIGDFWNDIVQLEE
jgi:hypothetical protein